MKRILILIASLNISGCVGFWVTTGSNSEVRDASNDKSVMLNGVRQQWTSIEHPANGTMRYNKELEWCGLALWVIVPIPLMLPICHSGEEVTFSNNNPEYITKTWPRAAAYFCGPGVYLATGMSEGSHGPELCSWTSSEEKN